MLILARLCWVSRQGYDWCTGLNQYKLLYTRHSQALNKIQANQDCISYINTAYLVCEELFVPPFKCVGALQKATIPTPVWVQWQHQRQVHLLQTRSFRLGSPFSCTVLGLFWWGPQAHSWDRLLGGLLLEEWVGILQNHAPTELIFSSDTGSVGVQLFINFLVFTPHWRSHSLPCTFLHAASTQAAGWGVFVAWLLICGQNGTEWRLPWARLKLSNGSFICPFGLMRR